MTLPTNTLLLLKEPLQHMFLITVVFWLLPIFGESHNADVRKKLAMASILAEYYVQLQFEEMMCCIPTQTNQVCLSVVNNLHIEGVVLEIPSLLYSTSILLLLQATPLQVMWISLMYLLFK